MNQVQNYPIQLVHQLYTADNVWAQQFINLKVGDSCVSSPCYFLGVFLYCNIALYYAVTITKPTISFTLIFKSNFCP